MPCDVPVWFFVSTHIRPQRVPPNELRQHLHEQERRQPGPERRAAPDRQQDTPAEPVRFGHQGLRLGHCDAASVVGMPDFRAVNELPRSICDLASACPENLGWEDWRWHRAWPSATQLMRARSTGARSRRVASRVFSGHSRWLSLRLDAPASSGTGRLIAPAHVASPARCLGTATKTLRFRRTTVPVRV